MSSVLPPAPPGADSPSSRPTPSGGRRAPRRHEARPAPPRAQTRGVDSPRGAGGREIVRGIRHGRPKRAAVAAPRPDRPAPRASPSAPSSIRRTPRRLARGAGRTRPGPGSSQARRRWRLRARAGARRDPSSPVSAAIPASAKPGASTPRTGRRPDAGATPRASSPPEPPRRTALRRRDVPCALERGDVRGSRQRAPIYLLSREPVTGIGDKGRKNRTPPRRERWRVAKGSRDG
jgi:hypothetical protein